MVVFQGDPGPDKQPRVAVSSIQTGATIQRLDDSKPAWVRIDTNFAGGVADVLGNAGTQADGFDVLYSTPVQAWSPTVAVVSGLASSLADASFNVGDVAEANVDPIILDAVAFETGGDAIINAPLDNPPAPDTSGQPPDPPPITIGGGGDTGSGPTLGGGGEGPDFGSGGGSPLPPPPPPDPTGGDDTPWAPFPPLPVPDPVPDPPPDPTPPPDPDPFDPFSGGDPWWDTGLGGGGESGGGGGGGGIGDDGDKLEFAEEE